MLFQARLPQTASHPLDGTAYCCVLESAKTFRNRFEDKAKQSKASAPCMLIRRGVTFFRTTSGQDLLLASHGRLEPNPVSGDMGSAG